MMTRFCSFFFYEGYIGVSPTIINLAHSLQKEGYKITIYARKNNYESPDNLGEYTTIKYYNTLPFTITKIINKIPICNLSFIIESLFWSLQILFDFSVWHNLFKSTVIIGIDTWGVLVGFMYYLAVRAKARFIYLSLELNEPRSRMDKIINKLERIAYKNASCLLIQDKDRLTTLNQYNNYQHHQCFYIPNSSLNSISSSTSNQNINFFRGKFNLDREAFPYLIVQAGMIDELVFSKTLAKAFSSLSDRGYALIFHERQKKSLDDPYLRSLQKINSNNLFLSLDPVAFSEIDKVYISITIGLAFYQDIDNNFSQISMASGKLGYYLKHGKPVLVNNLPSFVNLIAKYEIGIIIDDPSDPQEIDAALREILENYDFYSQNARRCFELEFDFEKKVELFLALLRDLP